MTEEKKVTPRAVEVNVEEKKQAEGKLAGKPPESDKDWRKILEEIEKILKEGEDRYLRLRADFENYRKRSVAEREEIISFANEVLLVALLPVLDNFERTIEAINNLTGLDKSIEEILKGIALVHRHMLDTFTKMGLEEIAAAGKNFDPIFHEAALQKKDPQHQSGEIIEVLQKGYLFKGKIIRPAMVVVVKNE